VPLLALVEPAYPKADNGRPPIAFERMLPIYFLQQSFDLSEPGVEEAPAAATNGLTSDEIRAVLLQTACRSPTTDITSPPKYSANRSGAERGELMK
jgi:hypothetical protein